VNMHVAMLRATLVMAMAVAMRQPGFFQQR
jgi:hypothetical protein